MKPESASIVDWSGFVVNMEYDMHSHIIAVANEKGGVGKTTTAINLSQALAIGQHKVLIVDLDPQGNLTQGYGMPLEQIGKSISDLILDRELPVGQVIYKGTGLDLIPASPHLARVEQQLWGLTNGELRLGRRLAELNSNYDFIIIDTPPTFGPLMNSALNAARWLVVPVDSGYFAMMGIKELLSEIAEIKQGTNPHLEVLGFLMTLCDQTKVAAETWDSLVSSFGDKVFETKIRRNVKLKESPVFGKTIFHHAPDSAGAQDYLALAEEVRCRLESELSSLDAGMTKQASSLHLIAGGVQ